MEQDKRVENLLFGVIDNLNQDLPDDEKIDKSRDTFLVGEGANTDSLTLIDLIVNAEKLIESEFNVVLALAEENIVFSDGTTVGSLIDHICARLKTK